MEGFYYGIMYSIETMVMGFNMVVTSVKPHYILMGFDLHGGGGQVGALNAPRDSQASCLIYLVRVFYGRFLGLCLVLGGGLTL